MSTQPAHGPRIGEDRRRRPTNARDALLGRGRRRRTRRDDERRTGHFVDLIDATTFLLAILLAVLTVVDGATTLVLLGADCEEANPAMALLIRRGPIPFLIGKYLLTVAGLPFLVIFRHFALFGTRFRVGHLLPVFVALYLLLIGYQAILLRSVPAVCDRGRPGASRSSPGVADPPPSVGRIDRQRDSAEGFRSTNVTAFQSFIGITRRFRFGS